MIDLTGLPLASFSSELMEFGGILTPPLGGPTQKIIRLGSRHRFAFETRALPALNPWSAKITAAKIEGALIRISEPGYVAGNGGSPVVAAPVTGGTSVPVSGLTAGFIVAPKWISIVHDGRRYAHMVVAAVTASSSGTATLVVTPMLRTPLAAGDAIEIAVPKAQGWLTDALRWAVPRSRMTSFSLTLDEAE